MSELLTCAPEKLWYLNLRSAREHRHINLWNLHIYCRHARQQIEVVEQWPVPKFRSYLAVIVGIVDKEWESPGD